MADKTNDLIKLLHASIVRSCRQINSFRLEYIRTNFFTIQRYIKLQYLKLCYLVRQDSLNIKCIHSSRRHNSHESKGLSYHTIIMKIYILLIEGFIKSKFGCNVITYCSVLCKMWHVWIPWMFHSLSPTFSFLVYNLY